MRKAGVVYLPDEKVFVLGDRPGLFARSAVVLPEYSDLRSRVLYCPPNGWFYGAHGVFDHAGNARYGPAKHGMDRVAIAVIDGVVHVNPASRTRGALKGTRYDEGDVSPAAFCADWGEGMDPEGPPGFVRPSFWSES